MAFELVVSPNSVVGELCPLVSPYTALSMITAVTSRFRAAWGPMCSIPMLRKSPSPATMTTFKIGPSHLNSHGNWQGPAVNAVEAVGLVSL